MEAGDLATWASAIAGSAVAALGVVVAARMLRVERDRDAASGKSDASLQADQVSAWIEMSRTSDPDAVVTTAALPDYPDVKLFNASPLPVYDVHVFLWVQMSASPGGGPPWENVPVLWQVRKLCPPVKEPEVISHYLRADHRQAHLMHHSLGISLSFKDAGGRRWHRTIDGVLRRAESAAGTALHVDGASVRHVRYQRVEQAAMHARRVRVNPPPR